jgi:hypothetical protein
VARPQRKHADANMYSGALHTAHASGPNILSARTRSSASRESCVSARASAAASTASGAAGADGNRALSARANSAALYTYV